MFIDSTTREEQCRAAAQIAERGFWFVDVPRTSSSSIRAELGAAYGSPYGKTNVLQAEYAQAQVFQDHIPAMHMRRLLGPEVWDRLFTFGFVRNPWERTYSLYHYRRRKGSLPGDWSFQTYVKSLYQSDDQTPGFQYHGFRLGAADYLLDDTDRPLVQLIGRYEARDRAIAEIGKALSLSTLGELRLQQASPAGLSFRDAYDEASRGMIGELYSRDVEIFGYEFW